LTAANGLQQKPCTLQRQYYLLPLDRHPKNNKEKKEKKTGECVFVVGCIVVCIKASGHQGMGIFSIQSKQVSHHSEKSGLNLAIPDDIKKP